AMRRMSPVLPAALSFVALISLTSPRAARAAWPNQSWINLQICRATNGQNSPMMVSDGSGGAIVTWVDGRNSCCGSDIYAHHVLASGSVDSAWPVDGRALCN